MGQKKSAKASGVGPFFDCYDDVNISGVEPREWRKPDDGKTWDELTAEEQVEALAYRRPVQAYPSYAKLAQCSVFDPLLIAMEEIYADFPSREQAHAEANSLGTNYAGLHEAAGERRYMNGVISGLLQIMGEAISAGHSGDATRFAFEAGLLWGMANMTEARRLAKVAKRGSVMANKSRSDATDLLRQEAQKRYQVLMAVPGAKRESVLKKMADGTLDEDRTMKRNIDGVLVSVPKWRGITTLREWTKGL